MSDARSLLDSDDWFAYAAAARDLLVPALPALTAGARKAARSGRQHLYPGRLRAAVKWGIGVDNVDLNAILTAYDESRAVFLANRAESLS